MKRWVALTLLVVAGGCVTKGVEEPSGRLITRHVPEIPAELESGLRQYNSVRSTRLQGWLGEGMLVSTRFGQTNQLHRVRSPLGMREQLTFRSEPVGEAHVPPVSNPTGFVLSSDAGGAEFHQYYHYQLDTGKSRRLTDGHSRYSGFVWARDGSVFAYATTERNGRDNDVHVRDLAGNRYATVEAREGLWVPLDFSADGGRLLLLEYLSANRSRLFELDIATGQVRSLLDDSVEAAFGLAQFDAAGNVYFVANMGAEFMRLHRLDHRTRRIEVLTADVPRDVELFHISPLGGHLAYTINEDATSRLVVTTLPERRFVALPEVPYGVIRGLQFSPDGGRLGVTLAQPTAPMDVFVVNLRSRSVAAWTKGETGGLDPGQFVAPRLIRYPSFDDRQIPAFVFTPPGPGPHPVVVYIHGGPESQYRPTLSTNFQYLVRELGIAVVAPNVRGSRGYGKTYLKLDDGRLREDAVRDIGALLDWIADQGEFDEARVGVWGVSYGGYMVLASLVHFGDRLAAGAASVGISNFVTFLENTQAYRRDLRRAEYGDERDPEMRAFLEGISPLGHADAITTPTLISHGMNDPRVPVAESEQLVTMLERHGVPVWYVLAHDEGHGFRKRRNRDYLNAVTMLFFQTHVVSIGHQ